MMRTSFAFCVFTFIGLALSAQDAPKPKASRDSEFKRPQSKHRTSRPVPNPWLGFGHDDHPAMRGATYLMKAEEIRALPRQGKNANNQEPLGFAKGSGLRIVGTGHSWMRPGYGTLPHIARAAGLEQRMRLNTRGGEAGGARMMWELENGILSSKGKPFPVCMAAITTGQWDVMTWGGYTNDRPEYYFGWIDFCQQAGPVAQWTRHRSTEPEIVGSSPTRVTLLLSRECAGQHFFCTKDTTFLRTSRGATWFLSPPGLGK